MGATCAIISPAENQTLFFPLMRRTLSACVWNMTDLKGAEYFVHVPHLYIILLKFLSCYTQKHKTPMPSSIFDITSWPIQVALSLIARR